MHGEINLQESHQRCWLHNKRLEQQQQHQNCFRYYLLNLLQAQYLAQNQHNQQIIQLQYLFLPGIGANSRQLHAPVHCTGKIVRPAHILLVL